MQVPVTTGYVRQLGNWLQINDSNSREWAATLALAETPLPDGWDFRSGEDGTVVFIDNRGISEPQAEHPLLKVAADVLQRLREHQSFTGDTGAGSTLLGPFQLFDSPGSEFFYLDVASGKAVMEFECSPSAIIPPLPDDLLEVLDTAAGRPGNRARTAAPEPSTEALALGDTAAPKGDDEVPDNDLGRASYGVEASQNPSSVQARRGEEDEREGQEGQNQEGQEQEEKREQDVEEHHREEEERGEQVLQEQQKEEGEEERGTAAVPTSDPMPERSASPGAAGGSGSGSVPASGSGSGAGLDASASSVMSEPSYGSVLTAAPRTASAAGDGASDRGVAPGGSSSFGAPSTAAQTGHSMVDLDPRAGPQPGPNSSAGGRPQSGAGSMGGRQDGGGNGEDGASAAGELREDGSGAEDRGGDAGGSAAGSERGDRSASSSGRGGAGSASGGVSVRAGGAALAPPANGRLTFFGWWFEDAESTDLSLRVDGATTAGGGLVPRHVTLTYSFATASFSFTLHEPAQPGAAAPPDRSQRLCLRNLAGNDVLVSAGGGGVRPVGPLDLHVGARLVLLGRPVVLKNAELGTAQWHAGHCKRLAALREQLWQEVQKYRPRALRGGLVMDVGAVRQVAGAQLRHMAAGVRALAEELARYRPSKGEAYLAQIPAV